MNKSRIGRRIREERKKQGYTLERFSEAVNISPSFMSDIERGIKMPSLSTLEKIINILETVSADYLLRDFVVSGRTFVVNDITKKLVDLTPKQLRIISDIIDTVIENFNEVDDEDDEQY